MTEPIVPVAHRMTIIPRPKMDAPGLVAAVCSCGRYQSSSDTPDSARFSFQAHANSMAARDFPEHRKLAKIADQSQTIGAFLDNTPYTLCELVGQGGYSEWQPVGHSIQALLAGHFGIDEDKIEAEKRTMLELLRSQNTKEGE